MMSIDISKKEGRLVLGIQKWGDRNFILPMEEKKIIGIS
jgi:hypothetical protein